MDALEALKVYAAWKKHYGLPTGRAMTNDELVGVAKALFQLEKAMRILPGFDLAAFKLVFEFEDLKSMVYHRGLTLDV